MPIRYKFGNESAHYAVNFLIFIVLLLFISEFQLQQLTKEVNNSKRHAYAGGSFKNLHVQWRSYFMFCEYFKL